MFERIASIISNQLGIDETDIKMETTLEETGLDSLDMVDIIYELEEEFFIELPDEEIQDVRTVGDLLSVIQKKTEK